MYAIAMQLYAASGSQINTDIYEKLAQTYHLPSIESLLMSMEQDIEWGNVDKAVQVYFIDNLREPNRRHVFQIRFKTNPDAHEHTAIFVSIESKQVHNLSLQFPSRGDRHCSAKIIEWLKEITKSSGTDVEFELAGYGERDTLRYIREHSLSAFQWHAELNRYLHVTDRPWEVKETKKGMARG